MEEDVGELSKEELRKQLFSSLHSTGILDSLKSQLRARLLDHLRDHNADLLEPKNKKLKPSLTDRLLSSLFLEYLQANDYTFTISVFLPESQMVAWPPFSYDEMLELLHLDPTSDLHLRLTLAGEKKGCLAQQLVMVLQKLPSRGSIHEASTQTSEMEASARTTQTMACTSPRNLEKSIKEIDDAYIRKREAHDAQRLLPYRSLEDRITVLQQEFDARLNVEVAMQVSRVRDYEISAARMDEAARYRRQLARNREELEEIHRSRMDRIKAREESLLERLLAKEKAVEASAYEQRQKILSEICSLREREDKLRQFKESQEKREEKLDEREISLKAKEEEVVLMRKAIYEHADDITASKRKKLEEQYRELCNCLHSDRTLLEAELDHVKEERVAMAIELASARSDKELIHALHHRLNNEEDQRLTLLNTIKDLEQKLKQESCECPISASSLEEKLRMVQAELEQERTQRQVCMKEVKSLEHTLQLKEMEVAALRSPQAEWIAEHKSLMATIHQQEAALQDKEFKLQIIEAEKEKWTSRQKKLLIKVNQLETVIKDRQEEKENAIGSREVVQVQLRTNERELLETVTLLKKAQQALESERLQHYALRSRMNALLPSYGTSVELATDPKYLKAPQCEVGRGTGISDGTPAEHISLKDQCEALKCFSKEVKPGTQELWSQLLSKADRSKEFLSHPTHSLSTTFAKPFFTDPSTLFLELPNDFRTSTNGPLTESGWLHRHGRKLTKSSRRKRVSQKVGLGTRKTTSPPLSYSDFSIPAASEPEASSATKLCNRICVEAMKSDSSMGASVTSSAIREAGLRSSTANYKEIEIKEAKVKEILHTPTESLTILRGQHNHGLQEDDPNSRLIVEKKRTIQEDGPAENLPWQPGTSGRSVHSETTQTVIEDFDSETKSTDEVTHSKRRIEISITKKTETQLSLSPDKDIQTRADLIGEDALTLKVILSDWRNLTQLAKDVAPFCWPSKPFSEPSRLDDIERQVDPQIESENCSSTLEVGKVGRNMLQVFSGGRVEGLHAYEGDGNITMAGEKGLCISSVAGETGKLEEKGEGNPETTTSTTKADDTVPALSLPLFETREGQTSGTGNCGTAPHETDEDPGFFVNEVDNALNFQLQQLEEPNVDRRKRDMGIQIYNEGSHKEEGEVPSRKPLSPTKLNTERKYSSKPTQGSWAMASMKGDAFPEHSQLLSKHETSLRGHFMEGRHGYLTQESEDNLAALLNRSRGEDNRVMCGDSVFNLEHSLEFSGKENNTFDTLQPFLVSTKQEMMVEDNLCKQDATNIEKASPPKPPELASADTMEKQREQNHENSHKVNNVSSLLVVQHDVLEKQVTELDGHDSGAKEEKPQMGVETVTLGIENAVSGGRSSQSNSQQESGYKGESFEPEGEAEGGEETAHSEESCTNSVVRVPRIRSNTSLNITDLRDPDCPRRIMDTRGEEDKRSERSSEGTSANAAVAWGMKSEQGSYSPAEDLMEDPATWLEGCGTSLMLNADEGPLDFGDVFSAPASDTSKSSSKNLYPCAGSHANLFTGFLEGARFIDMVQEGGNHLYQHQRANSDFKLPHT